METLSVGLGLSNRKKQITRRIEVRCSSLKQPSAIHQSPNTHVHPLALLGTKEVSGEKNPLQACTDIQCVFFDYEFEIPYSKYLDLERYRNPLCKAHIKLAHKAYFITTSNQFGHMMMLCILTAGLLVGVESYPELTNNSVLLIIDTTVTAFFYFRAGAQGVG